MTSAERFELACAPLAAAAAWLAWPALPHAIALGHALLAASAAMLFQSLVRDLWLLRAARARARTEPSSATNGLCVESALGMAGVVAGALVAFAAAPMTIAPSRAALALAVFALVVAGFLLKDWIVERNPWRLRRDPDHMNLVVRWR